MRLFRYCAFRAFFFAEKVIRSNVFRWMDTASKKALLSLAWKRNSMNGMKENRKKNHSFWILPSLIDCIENRKHASVTNLVHRGVPRCSRQGERRGASMNYNLNFHDYLSKTSKVGGRSIVNPSRFSEAGGRRAPCAPPLGTPLLVHNNIFCLYKSSADLFLSFNSLIEWTIFRSNNRST